MHILLVERRFLPRIALSGELPGHINSSTRGAGDDSGTRNPRKRAISSDTSSAMGAFTPMAGSAKLQNVRAIIVAFDNRRQRSTLTQRRHVLGGSEGSNDPWRARDRDSRGPRRKAARRQKTAVAVGIDTSADALTSQGVSRRCHGCTDTPRFLRIPQEATGCRVVAVSSFTAEVVREVAERRVPCCGICERIDMVCRDDPCGHGVCVSNSESRRTGRAQHRKIARRWVQSRFARTA